MKLDNQRLHIRLDDNDNSVERSAQEQQILLTKLNDHLEENGKQIRYGNAITSKIAERFDWIRNLGQDTKNFMQDIYLMACRTYNIVVDIQRRLPSHPYEQFFTLEDSHGRVFPIQMMLIDSWEAFDAILEVQFRHKQGLRMVQQKKYVLHESVANRDIERRFPWERMFSPGQRIVMCMLFTDCSESNYCPNCYFMPVGSEDSDVNW